MTKVREPLSHHHTLVLVADKIGWARCAEICEVSERAVRYWSDPDQETEIRMIDAERLDQAFMEAGGGYAPFHRLMTLRLSVASAEVNAKDIATLSSRIARSAGYATAALLAIIQEPTNIRARRTARKEMQEVIYAMTDCLALLERS